MGRAGIPGRSGPPPPPSQPVPRPSALAARFAPRECAICILTCPFVNLAPHSSLRFTRASRFRALCRRPPASRPTRPPAGHPLARLRGSPHPASLRPGHVGLGGRSALGSSSLLLFSVSPVVLVPIFLRRLLPFHPVEKPGPQAAAPWRSLRMQGSQPAPRSPSTETPRTPRRTSQHLQPPFSWEPALHRSPSWGKMFKLLGCWDKLS